MSTLRLPVDGSMDHGTHVSIPRLTPVEHASLTTFRKLLESDPSYPKDIHIRAFCNDTNLWKFLKARNGDHNKALKMILTALEWRHRVKPHLIPASEIESEAKMGVLFVKTLDRWGRPLIMMNAGVKPTNNDELQLKALFFQLERARQKMQGHIDKYVIFINLEHFSVWSAPALKTSLQTVETLLNRYPEHLGHAVLYKASFVFKGLWSAVSPFIDAKTKSKMLFIRGDTSNGSSNDKILKRIIGDDWKLLAGIDLSPASLPYRYNHAIDFPIVISEQIAWLGAYQKRLDEFDWKGASEESIAQFHATTNTNTLSPIDGDITCHQPVDPISTTTIITPATSALTIDAIHPSAVDADVDDPTSPLSIPAHLTGEAFDLTSPNIDTVTSQHEEDEECVVPSFHDS